MSRWRLDISDERADTLLYLFSLLRDNGEAFLNTDLIEPITRYEIVNLMEWYEKAYYRKKALDSVEERFRGK